MPPSTWVPRHLPHDPHATPTRGDHGRRRIPPSGPPLLRPLERAAAVQLRDEPVARPEPLLTHEAIGATPERPAANWTSGRITRGGIADRVLHCLLVVDDDAHRTRSDRPCYGDRVSGRPSDDVPLQRIRTAIELLEIAEDMLRQRLRRTHSEVPPEDIEDLVRSWLERRPGAELGDAPGVPRGIPGR
jgi:hypothetical protein